MLNKKETLAAFKNCFSKIHTMLVNVSLNYDFIIADLLASMYVMVLFVVNFSKKDSDFILKWIFKAPLKEPENAGAHFNARVEFYKEIANGRPLRGECLNFSDTLSSTTSPTLRCAIAFGDCLCNFECIFDYDGAPVVLVDSDTAGISNFVFLSAFQELNSFNNYLHFNIKKTIVLEAQKTTPSPDEKKSNDRWVKVFMAIMCIIVFLFLIFIVLNKDSITAQLRG